MPLRLLILKLIFVEKGILIHLNLTMNLKNLTLWYPILLLLLKLSQPRKQSRRLSLVKERPMTVTALPLVPAPPPHLRRWRWPPRPSWRRRRRNLAPAWLTVTWTVPCPATVRRVAQCLGCLTGQHSPDQLVPALVLTWSHPARLSERRISSPASWLLAFLAWELWGKLEFCNTDSCQTLLLTLLSFK